MALFAQHKETSFGVGDRIQVTQAVKEGDKSRLQTFEGLVIAIKGRGAGKTFTVRRIGEQQVGIERIFPLDAPNIEKITVVKSGTLGVRHAKLFYTRGRAQREVDEIFSRAHRKGLAPQAKSRKAKPKPARHAKSKK